MPLVPGRQIAALIAALTIAHAAATPTGAQSLRPLETESAALLPSGATQIILGTSYFRNRRWPAFTEKGYLRSQDLVTAPELEVRVGAGDWVEIQLRYELLYVDESRSDATDSDEFGGGDAEIFTKLRFLREGDLMPALGARFGVKLPNASRDDRLGTDETDFEIAVLGSKTFGPITAHLNLGLQILGNPGPLDGDPEQSGSGQDDPFVFSLAAVSQPLFADDTGSYAIRALLSFDGLEASRFANDRWSVNGGLQVGRGNWTLYGGASGGLSGAAEDYGLRLGAIYAFELERLRGLFD